MVNTHIINTAKLNARKSLVGNRTDAVFACLAQLGTYVICIVGLIVPLLFAGGVLNIGFYEYCYILSANKKPKVSVVFNGFNHFTDNLLISWARGTITFLWSLLLIVPGIIVGLMYSQTNFIALLDPKKKVREVLRESASLMRGRKWEFFLFQLSFIGWFALSVATLGIALLWVMPYYTTAKANYFKFITSNKENN